MQTIKIVALIVATLVWGVAMCAVILWCVAAVDVGSGAAAGLGGFAIAALWITKPWGFSHD